MLALPDGEAEEACEHLDPQAWNYEGSEKNVFEILATRFPERKEMDTTTDAIADLLSFHPSPNERAALVGSQFQLLLDGADRQEMKVSPKVAGMILITACRFSRTDKTTILA